MSLDNSSPLTSDVPREFKVAMAWLFGTIFILLLAMKICGTFNNGVVNDSEALVAIQRLEDNDLNDDMVPVITNLVPGNKRVYLGGDPYNVRYQYEVNGEVQTAICTKGPASALICTRYVPNNLSP